MHKRQKYMVFAAMVTAALVVAYGTFERVPGLARDVTVKEVVSRIEEALAADPDYLVTDYLDVYERDPTYGVLESLVCYPQLGLQVTVRSSSAFFVSGWRTRIHRLVKWLPSFLRSRVRLIEERKQIDIYVLEPTEDELQKLKDHIESLRIPHSIPVHIEAYYPER